ncbi:GNAT family N-acetyltransferase [Cytobacillus purgationiresistens]|uniref:Ribosomal-protein-alanine N-acetyltransferase n=1 Tax=Cytobacillus purgationiresistens TaxID=863449 RepID=A0ABU0AKX8_9BACI|nr:GNAT family protein [Cytobacillus purgationiresistens]MDQ0271432.1 ribosomal-protein-alanine N-acetyltransferase [Cytobacillus purgationiresistens]
MFPIIETDKLILREITTEDTENIFSCFSNSNVTKYYGMEKMETLDQAENLVRFFLNSFQEKRGIRWGIQIKDTEGITGTIGFNAWSPKHRRAEIGYEIHPNYWRKGYVSEAIHKVIDYGFNHMNLTRIAAHVFIENDASNQLLENAGFLKEGILRNYMYQDGQPHDVYVYSIIKAD